MGDSIAFRRDSTLIGGNSQTLKHALANRIGISDSTGGENSLTMVCWAFQDVYYNIYTNEIVSIENQQTICFSDGGSIGSGSSGSSGGSAGSSSSSNGSYGTTATSDTEDNSPPADCSSWLFRAVGPSGYMSCGVRDIRIDVLSQYMNSAGEYRMDYTYFVFNTYTLFFEMPPRYTPGEAAAICAGLKDQAEGFVENKYGNSTPPNGDVLANTFYSRLASLMQSYGGRLTKVANYANTPVGEYGETLLPSNGGCN